METASVVLILGVHVRPLVWWIQLDMGSCIVLGGMDLSACEGCGDTRIVKFSGIVTKRWELQIHLVILRIRNAVK